MKSESKENNKIKYKRLILGGCFLFLHPGHIYLLKEAKKISNEVWVVVASDKTLKEKHPYQNIINQKDRARSLEAIKHVDKVILGKEVKDYSIIKEVDAIGLGYDQEEAYIKNKLKEYRLEGKVDIVKFKAYHPEKYSVSKILGRK